MYPRQKSDDRENVYAFFLNLSYLTVSNVSVTLEGDVNSGKTTLSIDTDDKDRRDQSVNYQKLRR